MKKMINLLAIFSLAIIFGCSSGGGSYYDDEYYELGKADVQSEEEMTGEENQEQAYEDKYLAPEESSGNEDLSRSDYSEVGAGAAAYNYGATEFRDTTEIPIIDDKYFDDEGNEVDLGEYEAPIEEVDIGSGYRRYFEYYYPTVVSVDYDPFYYDPYYNDPYWSFSIGFGGFYGGWSWGISWGWGGYYPPYYGYYPPYYGYYPPYYGYYPPYYCDPYYGDGYYGYVPSETRYRNNYNGDLRDNRGGRGASNDLTGTSNRSRDVGLDGLAVSSRGGNVSGGNKTGRSGGENVEAQRKGRNGEIDRTYKATKNSRDLELASLKAERREAVSRGTDKRSGSGKTKRGGYTVQSTKNSRSEISEISGKGTSRGSKVGDRTASVSNKTGRGEISASGRKSYTSSSKRVPKDYGRTTSLRTKKSSSSRNSVESYYSKNKSGSQKRKTSSKYTTGTYKRSSSGFSGSSKKSSRSSSSYSSSRKTGSSKSVSSKRSTSTRSKTSSRKSSSRSSSKSYSSPSRRSSKSHSSPSRSGSRSSSYRSSSSSRSHSSYGSRSSSHSSGSRSSGSRGSSGGRRR